MMIYPGSGKYPVTDKQAENLEKKDYGDVQQCAGLLFWMMLQMRKYGRGQCSGGIIASVWRQSLLKIRISQNDSTIISIWADSRRRADENHQQRWVYGIYPNGSSFTLSGG